MPLIDEINSALSPAVIQLCTTLKKHGHQAWLVGGAVRELLRKGNEITVADFDFATTATPAVMLKLFHKVIPTGIEHGTVTVLLQGQSFEVTTLRGEEGYSDGRHPDRIYFTENLHEDLARRDFTINAIAYDPLTGVIDDPFNGRTDLSLGLIKAVGDAPTRFEEDGLRIMRCARFAAKLEFTVEQKTLAALQPSIPSYKKVAKERIIDEWWKAFATQRPSLCFALLHQEKILHSTSPDFINAAVSVTTWSQLNLLSSEHPCTRLAFLLLETFVDDQKKLSAFLREMKLSQKQAQAVEVAIRATRSLWQIFNATSAHALSDIDLRMWIAGVGRADVKECLPLFRAYGICRLTDSNTEESFFRVLECIVILAESPCAYSRKELALSGKDLMQLGIEKGPLIGQLLDEMRKATLLDPQLNTGESLTAWLKESSGSSKSSSA